MPGGWDESLVRVGTPVPVQTMLKSKPWEDMVWQRPIRLELESGIPRDRMLPNPVGHFFMEDSERLTCHGVDGPAPWPKIDEVTNRMKEILMFDRKGPPGHMRKLTVEEIWVLQGRSLVDLKKCKEASYMVTEGCRATGIRTASALLLCAGQMVENKLGEAAAKAGGCREHEDLDLASKVEERRVWEARWRTDRQL